MTVIRPYRWWKARRAPVRYTLAALGAAGILVSLALLTSPLWLTPILQSFLPQLRAQAARQIGVPVQIRSAKALIGWHPGLALRDVLIGTGAVAAQSVRVRLSWLALFSGRIRPARVTLIGPQAVIVQTATGMRIRGLPRGGAMIWQSFLLHQPALIIRHGALDIRLLNGSRPTLRDVDASWDLGLRTAVARVAARVPDVCTRCAVTIHVSHAALKDRVWRGAAGVDARNLRLGRLPALSATVPRPLQGRFSGRLWTVWRGPDLRFVGGQGHLARAVLPGSAATRTLAITDAKARFSYTRTVHGFRFYAGDVAATLAGRTWRTKTFYLGRQGDAWNLSADALDITQVRYALSRIRGLPRRVTRIAAAKLQGRLAHFRLRFTAGAHLRYRVRTRFFAVGVDEPHRPLHFGHLAGALRARTDGGRLLILDWHGRAFGPPPLRGPFRIERASAAISWTRATNGYSVEVPQFHLVTGAGRVGGAASVVAIAGQSPQVLVHATVRDVAIRQMTREFLSGLSQQTRAWLKQTLQGGTIQDGDVVLKGPLDQFPFRHGQGLFTADLHVKDGRYQFLPSWPSATAIHATVRARNAALTVTGHAHLGDLALRKLSVRVTNMGTRAGVAAVVVRSRGTLPALLRVIGRHLGPQSAYLPPPSQAGGLSHMTLGLRIPFGQNGPITLGGDLFFEHDTFAYPWRHGTLRVADVTGTLGFDQLGPTTGHVRGQALGGPLRVALSDHQGVVTTIATGEIRSGGLRQALGPLSTYASGHAAWRIHAVDQRNGQFGVAAEVNLKGTDLRMPYPAGKAPGVPLMAYVQAVGNGHGRTFSLVLPHHVGFRYQQRAKGAAHGWLGIGRTRPPAQFGRGLHVAIESAYINTDSWVRFIKALLPLVRTHGAPATGLPVRTVTVHAGSLVFAGRVFRDVHGEFLRTRTRWLAQVAGPDAQGAGVYISGPKPFLQLAFRVLAIPPVTVRPDGHPPALDPRQLPRVDFEADSLRIGRRRFGRAVLVGEPFRAGFRFYEIRLTQPQAVLAGHGRWTLHAGQQESTFAVRLQAANLGHTLTAWGYPRQVAGGHVDLYAGLNWPGDPTQFALRTLQADLRFTVRNGRFLNVNEGAGKLLGIFNVDSITRYLTLDFSSLFGRGFAFGLINGKVYVEQGRAITPAIEVHGPTANVHIEGRANLVAQTFHLQVGVNPHLQNNVTLLSGLLGGPIAGAAVLVMQKFFAREISEGTRMTYVIDGPWNKPVIKRRADAG
ncbi:MAG: YhdP family protein [Gammaproteobacteria bacterium]|nr:YhdP family protein [Gammaproteobacteria bacterium]